MNEERAVAEEDPISGEPPGSVAGSGRKGFFLSQDGVWIWFIALLFAALNWWPLVANPRGGLQGGDIFTYFFPLKAWYAERLAAGELPMWNPRIGHGIPALGESQTGVFYPFNLLFYRCLPLGAAYSANFLLHYVLAFGFTCHYARRLGLGRTESLLVAVVFVYGWFPARSCLEWAIVTGAWLPLALWGTDAWLMEGRGRWLVVIETAILMQLLAGHFHIAFITLITLAVYAPLRRLAERGAIRVAGSRLVWLAIALMLACALAAIQLVPSWELKQRSQRSAEEFGAHKIGYGGIPWPYLGQIVRPSRFYAHVNESEFNRQMFGDNNTNKVEAHLYFGLVPLLLAAVTVVAAAVRRGRASRLGTGIVCLWLVIGALCLLLTPGWWTGWVVHVPGFGYFTGPGRYGIITQLAVSILAGYGTQDAREVIRWLLARWPRVTWLGVLAGCLGLMVGVERWMSWAGGLRAFATAPPPAGVGLGRLPELALVLCLLAGVLVVVAARRRAADVLIAMVCVVLAWADVWRAGQFVQYAEVRADSPILHREESVVRGILARTRPDARVLARNQNSVSLCDVATVPTYLGIGPREYFDGPLTVPSSFHWEPAFSPDTLRWLEWSGITHVLAFDAMDDKSLELVWAGHDPFLHELLGRPPTEPLYLYALRSARGRAYWIPAARARQALDASSDVPVRAMPVVGLSIASNLVEFVVETDQDAVTVLTDLNYPGWKSLVDDHPAQVVAGVNFRAVCVPPGRHRVRWVYEPQSLAIGWAVSLASLVATCVLVWRRW